MTDLSQPPVAARRPHSFTHHGITLTDDYAWLRDPGYPEVTDKQVLDYLEQENRYFEAAMAPHKALTDTLFAEMKGRIKEDDQSVPQKDGDYIYWRAFEIGAQYRKWYRKPVAGGPDQLILDETALAQGHDYFRLGAMSVSPDGRYLAYAIDTNGSERFEARIKDLLSGEILPEVIPDTLSSLVWTSDSKGLLYGIANDNWRTDNTRLHWLGQSVTSDVELFHEDDEGFRVSVGLTSSEKWIVIATGDHVTSEAWLIPSDDPNRVTIDVDADGPSWLLLSDVWYPGWEARVDGVANSVWQADYLFRAVPVPSGRHVVEFSYRPRSFLLGLILAAAGLGAMAGSCRNRGGVVGSDPTVFWARNSMTWPVVAGSAASNASPWPAAR